MKKHKHKTNKTLLKRLKITGTGKIMRSNQLRTSHLRRNKSKSALRRHAKNVVLSKTMIQSVRRALGL